MLSSENLSILRAEHYYDEENGLPCVRVWYGKGAALLHLPREVTPDDFRQLIRGRDLQGNLLHGKPPALERHRVGTDFTFSAPKSVSLAAICNPDVIEAHHHGVLVSLAVLESYAEARMWNGKQQIRVPTQNIGAAIAPHRLSREQDPQLHTHVFVLNASQLADGTWRALSNEEMVANKKLVGQIYQNQLAYNLRQLGYEIEVKPHGQFELKDYPKTLLDKFSTRRQQRDDYLSRTDQPLTPKTKRQAILHTRKGKKVIDWDALEQQWQQRMTPAELDLLDAPLAPESDLEQRGKISAATAAIAGINHLQTQEFQFKREILEQFMLENYLGQQSWEQIEQALDQSPQLQAIDESKNLYTTPLAARLQQSCLQRIEQGKGVMPAIASEAEIAQTPTEFLTSHRRQAWEQAVATTDQFVVWQDTKENEEDQGSYAEQVYRQFAHQKGYRIRELDGAEPQLDHESNSSSIAQTPEVWIVRRAESLSVPAIHALLETAHQEQAKVLLLGDTRRLSPKNVGNPLKVLQQEGLTTIDFERADDSLAILSPPDSLANLEKTHAQTQKTEAIDADNLRITQDTANWGRWLGSRLATRLTASLSENQLIGSAGDNLDRSTHDLARSLEQFDERDAIANHDPESIAQSIKEFAERREINGLVQTIIETIGGINEHSQQSEASFRHLERRLHSPEPITPEKIIEKLAVAEVARLAKQLLHLSNTETSNQTKSFMDAASGNSIQQSGITLEVRVPPRGQLMYNLKTGQHQTNLSTDKLSATAMSLQEQIEAKAEENHQQRLLALVDLAADLKLPPPPAGFLSLSHRDKIQKQEADLSRQLTQTRENLQDVRLELEGAKSTSVWQIDTGL